MVVDRTNEVRREMHRRAMRGVKIAQALNVKTAKELAPFPEPVEHPYATGTTKREIFGSEVVERGGEMRCRVINPMEYGADQEFGPQGSGKRWRFTPHIRPALDHIKGQFRDIIERAVYGK